MASLTFWRRYLGRRVLLTTAPALFGPRDRLIHYEQAPPWRPEQGLAAFVAELVRDQQLAEAAPRVRAFLEFWAPIQAYADRGDVLLEFSFTTNKPGFGVMMYGENVAMTRAFRRWCRLDGIPAEVADRGATLCETFEDAAFTMVRAEFRPGDPPRTSLFSTWLLDPLRWTGGFSARFARLPPAHRSPALEARVRALEERLAPDYFPLFLGLSLDGGLLLPKLYFVRYAEEAPLARGGAVEALVAELGMNAGRLAAVRSAYQRLWAASADPMTQILVELPGEAAAPPRINLITCGTRTGAIKDLLTELDDPRFDARAVLPFEKMMQTGRAKYAALRLSAEGISPRVKLYGQAAFSLGS